MHVRRREKNFQGVERKKETVKLDLHIWENILQYWKENKDFFRKKTSKFLANKSGWEYDENLDLQREMKSCRNGIYNIIFI